MHRARPSEVSARPRRESFSIVEILVVIGIISVLIAILFPVLAKARRSALVLACPIAYVGEERVLSERVRASPVVADGKVYCTAADGETAVVKAGGAFELLARNSMDERVASTIVVSGGRLYLRSYDALYAIGRADPPAGGGATGGSR